MNGLREYFKLDFNFELNHKCVVRDNISKMGNKLASVRLIGSQNKKPRTNPN